MKKLNSQLFKSALMALGFFAMLSLNSCTGGGQADQDADKTEEAAPAEEMGGEDEMPADAAESSEAAADTTSHEGHDHEGHDHDEGDAEEGDEHPTGGSEHPN